MGKLQPPGGKRGEFRQKKGSGISEKIPLRETGRQANAVLETVCKRGFHTGPKSWRGGRLNLFRHREGKKLPYLALRAIFCFFQEIFSRATVV
jgi:hypothetical protein